MRPAFALLAALLITVGALVWLWIGGSPDSDAPDPRFSRGPPALTAQQPTDPAPHAALPDDRPSAAIVEEDRADADSGPEAPTEAPPDLFRQKWDADRQRLGVKRHDQMERLWSEAMKNRGTSASIEKLEQLLEDYPHTNRAGCAAWDLGHQYVLNRDRPHASNREAARRYWHIAIDRYGEAICEKNASVPLRAKLGLAAWVYRYSDHAMSRKLLDEVIAAPPEATTPDRISPAVSAKRLLDTLQPAE